jgi:hypothetical protein
MDLPQDRDFPKGSRLFLKSWLQPLILLAGEGFGAFLFGKNPGRPGAKIGGP